MQKRNIVISFPLFLYFTDHPIPVHYVEIGGVNSVVETDPNSAPATPYSVMHSFTGEDFATEDITSLTVVQFPSEETFPPQAPTTTMDSASGISSFRPVTRTQTLLTAAPVRPYPVSRSPLARHCPHQGLNTLKRT